MDKLEYDIDTIDGTPFEQLASDFLRAKDYDVHESGLKGTDGGWDARVEMGDHHGIAHASTRNDWRPKIREDASNVQDLEEKQDEDYNLFVFVTNQQITGQQQLDIEDEIHEEYDWNVQIYHRDNILGELRAGESGLAKQHFDMDLGTDRDHLEQVRELCNERIEMIRNRNGEAEKLQKGAAVAVHIVPTGAFSNNRESLSGDSPALPLLWELPTSRSVARGKSLLSKKEAGLQEPWYSYALLRNDGFYETVTADGIVENRGKRFLQLNSTRAGLGFDATVVLTVRRALAAMESLGFSGTATVLISLVGASGTITSTNDRGVRPFGGAKKLQTDSYTTEPISVTIGGDSALGKLEPALSEIWRELGKQNGTENIEDSEWVGAEIVLSGETLLESS